MLSECFLLALLQLPFASDGDCPTDRNLGLKWQTLKTCFLSLLATACRRSSLHTLSVAPVHSVFGRGDVDGQSTVSLLPEPGFIARNQLPPNFLHGWKSLGLTTWSLKTLERILCHVRKLYLYLNDTRNIRRGHKRVFIHWNQSIHDIPVYHSHILKWIVEVVKWRGSTAEGYPWWRHQMETFSTLLAICAGNSPGTGEFPAQRPVTRSFDVFFDLHLNKRLSKQS